MRQSLEPLEPRRLFAASLAGEVLTVTGTSSNDMIDLKIVNSDYKVTLNGVEQLFSLVDVDVIIVNGGDGHDSFFLRQAQDPVTMNGGNGIDDIEVGFGSSELEQSAVTITFNGGADGAGADPDVAGLWDGPSSGTRTWDITANTVTRSGWGGQLIYQSASIQISGGEANDTFNVQQLPADSGAKLFAGDGDDTLNLASGNLDALNGSGIMFAAEGGSGDTINLNDQLANHDDLYSITATNVYRLSPIANFELEYWDAEAMVINGEAGWNSYTVSGLPAGMPTTIKGGAGGDWLVAGGGIGAGNLATLASPLHWDGGAGDDSVFLEDSNAPTNRTFNITATSVSASGGFGGFTYGDAEALKLTGPSSAALQNTFRILSTPASRTFTIQGGSGSDRFVVGGGSPISGAGGNLDPLAGPLVVNGGAGGGVDFVHINDLGNTRNDAFTLTATTCTRQNWPGGLTYSGAEQVAINAGTGANTIQFNSAPTGAQVTILGGLGDDTIDVGAQTQTLNGIFGTHSIVGGLGNDALTLHDEQNTIAVVWYIDGDSVGRLPENSDPSTTLGYQEMESLRLDGSLGGNSIRVDDTNPATPLTIAPGLNHDNAIDVDGTHGPSPVTILPGTGAGSGPSVTVNLRDPATATAAVTFPQSIRLSNLFIYDNGTVSVPAGANALLYVKTLLFIANEAKLDLADNDLAIDYDGPTSPIGSWNGSAYTGLTRQIQRARNGGGWNGEIGIVTSMSDAAVGITTLAIAEARDALFLTGSDTALWDGQTVDATTVLIKYTYTGDANLDGQIDATDYGVIDNFIQFPGSSGYFNGDFNFDGVIDAGDYGYIDNNNQVQGPPL